MEFKPFEQMTAEDYADIGLMCGLEVHQQLLTDRKLFCHCPARRYSDHYDAEVLRHMRPTLSELGEYDGTALMEKKTRKNIHYRVHHESVCTYEFDDTPPFFPDERAVDIALEVALMLGLTLVGEMHIARKQYLDGSIPTGFQRTAILGVSGRLPYKDRQIGIRQLSLEEDSCREVSDAGHDRVFLTDRLGMPLIEVVTEPDMRTPRETAEVCQLIRMLCRSTGKVRTGYGAAREDVNVSVRGGTRIEIKGVPQISRIPRLVYNEARRQCSLLRIRDELRRRGVTPESFQWTSHNVTRALHKVQFQPVRQALERRQSIRCVVLRRFAGLLNRSIQEDTTFAKEFSDRVRVIACLTELPNLVHSDTATESLTSRHWKELRRRTGAEVSDALVLVWGNDEDTKTACQEIAIRAHEATQGVPSDTRQALKDGTNGFERVLPGVERMYPDTDLPPMAIDGERVARIQRGVPEPIWERMDRYRKMSVPTDVIEPLGISPRAALFDRVVRELDIDPVLAAVVLVQQLKSFARRGLRPGRLSDKTLYELFEAHAKQSLGREAIVAVIAFILAGGDEGGRTLKQWMDRRHAGDSRFDWKTLVRREVHDPTNLAIADEARRRRHVMGRLMRSLIGRAEGRQVAEFVDQQLLASRERNGEQREVPV